MAAKFVVLALAFCSASASICMPCISQQETQVAIPECVSAPACAVPACAVPACAVPACTVPACTVPACTVPTCTVTGAKLIASSIPTFVAGSSSDFCDSSFDLVASSSAATAASNGPCASAGNLPVLQAPPVTLNAVESPIIRLPSGPIPGPRVIRHKCYCTKTVVKPQVIQRTITVPRIQRYLKQSYRPVVENVAYQANPVGTDCQGEDIVIGGSSSSSSSPVFVSGCSSAPVLVTDSSSCSSAAPVVVSSGPRFVSVPSFVDTDCSSTCEHVVPVVPRCC